MLRFPQEEALYPGLLQVKMPVPPTHWLNLPGICLPPGDRWRAVERELGVHCVRRSRYDDTARKLTPLIRAWPGESQINAPPLGWIFSPLSVVI